jgi:LmbE family N-acetylglucosaminyl deacetylase
MHTPLRRLGFIICIALAGGLVCQAPRAQMRVVPLDDNRGHVALGLALRHLGNTGIFMHATAHPDDENNALLVMLNRGLGFRTTLATATRGNGGQNEIGPEIFEALGVLRTEELATMHRFDGAEQYFTRAVDFGFSFSIDETFAQWGREEITGDFVRLIRMIRPDVILGLRPDGTGGGQHHEASAVISRDAFKLAADPSKYPDQITAGLQPWQPKKYYFLGRFGGPRDAAPPGARLLSLDLARYDPLLGRTYAEIGTQARSMHKCQGMTQLLPLPGPAPSTFELVESTIPAQPGSAPSGNDEQSLFDGIDYTIAGLARFAGPAVPRQLAAGLAAIATAVQNAQTAFQTVSDAATVQPLIGGLRAVRRLRSALRAMPIDEAGRFDIEFRLRQKEREFQQAIVAANGVRIDALADDGVVVPGQPVKVSLIVANRGAADVKVKQVKFDGFSGEPSCSLTAVTAPPGGPRERGGPPPAGPAVSLLKKDQVAHCEPALTLKPDERATEPYWHRAGADGRYTFDEDAPFGLPYRPTPFSAEVTMTVGADPEEVSYAQPVQFRSEGDLFSGEKRAELLVVPSLSVLVSPRVAVLPAAGVVPAAGRSATPAAPPGLPDDTREIRVTVVNDTGADAATMVTLGLPSGWTATPAEHPVAFTREEESRTVRFQVKAARGAPSGEYRVAATASHGGNRFARGYQVIEYPHIRRQHIYQSAETTVKIIDVRVAPQLTVGYITGVGDEVPAAIAQLGAKVELIGPEELAWGNLSRFDTIVTGVRAYERRADLRANNSRVLDYVKDGGTLIVQYNKFEFNRAQYGPFPAKVTSERITDENAPVTMLNPNDPLLTTPNRISDATWRGWVQERGLYFLKPEDPRYRELLRMVDPFPYNKGDKTGALVSAEYGRGRWVYVGLGLWRELPAGVPGAYQLLANLLSYKG